MPTAKGSREAGGVRIAQMDGQFVQLHVARAQHLFGQLAAGVLDQIAKADAFFMQSATEAARRRVQGPRDLVQTGDQAQAAEQLLAGPSSDSRDLASRRELSALILEHAHQVFIESGQGR